MYKKIINVHNKINLIFERSIIMSLLESWGRIDKPLWKKYLEDAPDRVIEETNLSRDEIKKVLEVLYEHRIIN